MKRVLLIALAAAVAGALLAWPRINDVTTGSTTEYPDLKDGSYRESTERVTAALKAVLGRLPGWTLKGAGSGPGGFAVQAEHQTLPGLQEEVTIRVRREDGQTRVKVRSRSRKGPVDLGQNARNIRELLAALGEELR